MRKTRKAAAIVLCAAMLAGGCAQPESQQEETKQTDDGSRKEDGKQTEDQSREASKEKEYQAKLDAIQPSAYNNAEGLPLEKGAYISIIGKSKEGQYWEEVEKGAVQAAKDLNKELGYEGKDKIKVTYSAPSETDSVDEQVNILDEELARYPVALGIAIVDQQACTVQFDLAAESDIPVVAYDSGSDYQGLMATVSTDNESCGALAADHLAESMEGKGKVFVFAYDSKSKTGRQRMDGFTKKMKKEHPEIEIAGTYYMDQLEEMQKTVADEINAGTYEIPEKKTAEEIKPEDITQEEVIDYLLAKNPGVTGCYATNGDAVKLALESFDRQKTQADIALVGYDADKEELEALKEGRIDGLIVQNPFGMGYASVIAAARAALNLGNEAYVNTGFTWVTKDNLKEEAVKKILY